jgi:hypothetical protein
MFLKSSTLYSYMKSEYFSLRLVGWLRARMAIARCGKELIEMAGCPPGVENDLLDVVRSSELADYELKMAG